MKVENQRSFKKILSIGAVLLGIAGIAFVIYSLLP